MVTLAVLGPVYFDLVAKRYCPFWFVENEVYLKRFQVKYGRRGGKCNYGTCSTFATLCDRSVYH